MSYHNVQNDEDGIRAANQALDDVRALLRRRTGMSSIGAADDMDYALRFQLENMEDMLREITDARFARTLAEGQDVVARGNENVEILLFIVTTARDMLSTNNISLAGRSDGQKAQPQVPALSNVQASGSGASFNSSRVNRHRRNGTIFDSSTRPSVSKPWPDNALIDLGDVDPVGSSKGKQRVSIMDFAVTRNGRASPSATSHLSFDDDSESVIYSPASRHSYLLDTDTENDDVVLYHIDHSPASMPSPTPSLRELLNLPAPEISRDSLSPQPSDESSPLRMFLNLPKGVWLPSRNIQRESVLASSDTSDSSELEPNFRSNSRTSNADASESSCQGWAQTKLNGSVLSLTPSDASDEPRPGSALWEEDSGVPVAYARSDSSQSEHLDLDPCVACGEPLDLIDFLPAPCGHLYCEACVVNLVTAYASDETLHPLRCCKTEIPVSDIETVLCAEPDNLSLFQQKFEEYCTPHDKRTYCPQRDCGQFIKPPKSTLLGRRVGKVPDTTRCPACSASVCLLCKELVHPGENCEVSKNAGRLHELAKEKEWQTCSNCRSIVEKIEGCLHMICRCGFEFCYRCGAKYMGPGMCGH